MAKRTKNILSVGLVILLTACVSQVSPQWETYFSTTYNKNNIEWLKSSIQDNNEDLVFTGSSILAGSERTEDGLLFKYDQNGNQIWFSTYDFSAADGSYTSDEKLLDTVIDLDGNIYSVGHRRIKNNSGIEHSSFVFKTNQDGQLQWMIPISRDQDAFDIELFEGAIYVTGKKTQRLSLSGKIELEIVHEHRFWDIEVDSLGNIYIAGQAGIQKYDTTGSLIWQNFHTNGNQYSARVNIELDEQSGLVLLQPDLNNNSSLIQRYSQQGDLQWSKTLHIADDVSFAGQPALILNQGQIWAAVSDTFSRKVVNLSYQGQINWTYSDATGPIQDIDRLANGKIALTGSGHSALLTPQGKLIATNETTDIGNSLSGSLLINANKVFVGTSVSRSHSGIQIHLAMFEE